MHIVIKAFISGKKQRRCCCSPQQFLVISLFSIFVLLVQRSNCAVTDNTDEIKAWNLTTLDRLRMNLLLNYDKNAHPTYRNEHSNISIGMSVKYIDIDEMNGRMTLHSWLGVRWMDEKRIWNIRDYDNITKVHLKPKEVWKPDINFFNAAVDGSNYIGDTQILLGYEGSFQWIPPSVCTVYCNLNLLLWPYDKQTCKLEVGSWTQTYIDPNALNDSLDYIELVQSTEWEIVDAKAQYTRKDYYNYVEFSFVLQRRSSMYAAVIFTPACCIILLALSTFWLPPQMGEKILLNGVIIVIIAGFLMYFAQLLPILAENTPLIVLFYSTSLLLLSISTIIAVTVLYVATAKHKRRLPEKVRNILTGTFGKIFLLQHFTFELEPHSLLSSSTKELSEHVYDNPDNDNSDSDALNVNTSSVSSSSIQYDWILLATSIDRIFFLFYCILFIILSIVYSV